MIFWKEWRETLPLIILSGVAICLISHIKWDGWRIEYFEFQFWVVTALCLTFFAPFLGAGAVAGERENDTFEVLLARPVRMRRLFFVKYFVRLGGILLLLPVLLAVFYVVRPTHNLNLYDVVRGLAILASFLTFTLTASFLVSCFADTSSKAYIAGIALVYIALFLLNSTRFFEYVWWWRNSLEDMWLEYTLFYAALSAVVLIVSAALFSSRISFTYNWRHLAVAGVLIFFTFIRSVASTFWLVSGMAASGDVDLIRLTRQPVEEILDSTSRLNRSHQSWLRLYLVAAHNPRVERELVAQLENPEARIRNEAVRILTEREAEHVKGAVIPLLRDPDDEVKHSALAFVQVFKCEEALPEIINLLDDPNSSVRQRAVHALAIISEERAPPYLMKALKDRNPRVHLAAAQQLCRLDYGEAQEEIVQMMLESPIKYTRPNAARYLGMMKSAPACDALISVLSSEDKRLVDQAINSIGLLQCEESLELLLQMKDEFPELKLTMVNALRNIGGLEAKAALREMFAEAEPESDIRIEAALALAEMGDSTGVPYLRERLGKEKIDIRPEWKARHYVIRLARAGEYSAVPALIKLTDMRWPENNYRYGKMLEELSGKKYGWDVPKWQKWWEKNKDELLQDMLSGNVYKGGG